MTIQQVIDDERMREARRVYAFRNKFCRKHFTELKLQTGGVVRFFIPEQMPMYYDPSLGGMVLPESNSCSTTLDYLEVQQNQKLIPHIRDFFFGGSK